MVLVKTQITEDSAFDIDPSWLPMLYSTHPLRLPIRNHAAAQELVKYFREEAAKNRMLKKIKRLATLDAFHTGMPFRQWHEHVGGDRPRSQIDINMEMDFAASLDEDLVLKYNVARAARWLDLTMLYDSVVEQEAERIAAISFNGYSSVEDAKGYLFLETYLHQ